MSNDQFELFLNVCLGICAVMAALNLLRLRTQPARAILLCVAFLALGFTLFLLRSGASQTLIIVGAAVTCLCLVADFVLRSAARITKEKERPR
jgi:hypothetical protein